MLARLNIRDLDKGEKARATPANLYNTHIKSDKEKVCQDLLDGETVKHIEECLSVGVETGEKRPDIGAQQRPPNKKAQCLTCFEAWQP